jgi:L-alanine-DL-glutamate epimerase-like enolase superfamily enzyme
MRITRITQSRHRLPLDPPFPPAWDTRPRHHADLNLVRVETDEGLVGIGAGDTMPGFAGHEDLFIGRNPLDLARHNRVIDNLSFHYGRCWPLDIALWDLAGKITGQPIWRLLGGSGGGRVRCYASTGVLREPANAVSTAESLQEHGFPALKLRFHRDDWRDDLSIVEAVRAAVGGDMDILVDCNQAWRMPWDTAEPWTLKEALACARELEDLGVYWMEEPLHRADLDGMKELRQSTDIRIAAGEMARERHDAQQLVTHGCVDVLQTDAVFCGGLGGLSATFRGARDQGREISPHTWGDGIGLLANAHLAAGIGGCPYLEFPYDPPEWTPERRDLGLAAPLRPDGEGWLDLGETPGLGIDLDETWLKETELAR